MNNMPITWKLREYLDQNNITPYRLSKESGLAMSTIYTLAKAQPDRLDVKTLDTIMGTLERLSGKPVTFDDLLRRDPS